MKITQYSKGYGGIMFWELSEDTTVALALQDDSRQHVRFAASWFSASFPPLSSPHF